MAGRVVRCVCIAVSFATLVILGGGRAEAQTVITSNTTLTANPTCTPGLPCLSIQANGVHLDGAGFVVDCGGQGQGVVIVNQNNVTVSHLEIRNCTTGIQVFQGHGHVFSDITAHDNFGSGIALTIADRISVRSSTLNDNGSALGLSDADSGEIVDVTGTGSKTGSGLLMIDSDRNAVSRSNFSGSFQDGVTALNSHRNTFRELMLNGHSQGYGLIFGGSYSNAVLNSSATGNLNGFGVQASQSNSLQSNQADGNLLSGIRIESGANSSVISRNEALGNGVNDLFDGNVPACVNNWNRNNFVTDNEFDDDAGPGAGCIQ